MKSDTLFRVLCVFLAAALVASSEGAWARGKGKEKARAWTDPAKAAADDPDFSVQGEYTGDRLGLQVVALGGGKFYVVQLPGGLPGDGWDGRTVRPARLDTAGVKALVKRGRFKRVERESPTLAEKPPRDAVVLFDSSRAKETVANWRNGKVTTIGGDVLLMEGTQTARKFGSFRLHLEFRLPYKPTAAPSSQDRGNSGVYTFNRYETQLLDSFGLHFSHIDRDKKGSSAWKAAFQEHLGFGAKSDRSQWCACFYKFRTPKVNMCYPPLAWQTYEITFTAPRFEGGTKVKNARITLVHNGVTVHDDVELPKGTGAGGGRAEVAEESIYLQGHGNPVRFRNIWIVETGE